MLVRVYVLYSSSFIRVEMICRITTNGIFIFAKPIKTPTRLTTPSAPNRYYFRFYIRYFLCFYSLSVLLCLYYDFHNNNGKLIGIGLVIVCMPVNHMQMASEEKRKKKDWEKGEWNKNKTLSSLNLCCFQLLSVDVCLYYTHVQGWWCCSVLFYACITVYFATFCRFMPSFRMCYVFFFFFSFWL